MAAAALLACLTIASCGADKGARPNAPRPSGIAQPTLSADRPPESSPQAAPEAPSPAEPKPAKPPVAMKPASEPEAKKAAKPAEAKAADTLAGHDRNLVKRPFDAIYASDFEIGPLAGPVLPAGLDEALKALRKAVLERSLPEGLFSGEAAAVAALTLGPGLAELPEGVMARLGEPLSMAGGQFAVAIRLIGPGPQGSPDPSRSALGLAVFSAAEDGKAALEHLELDLASFSEARTREEPWDPYAEVR